VRTKGAAFAPAVEVQLVQVATTVTRAAASSAAWAGMLWIFEDGSRAAADALHREDTARELVIAVDISGSMAEAMPACRQAVKGLLGTCVPTTR
jgi:Mg-chelatase subunit ChlD